MEAPKKRRGRPPKQNETDEDPKLAKNRAAQRRYKEKVGKQIGGVLNDLDECDEERDSLKGRVATLTKLLASCETQVAGIVKEINAKPPAKVAKPAMPTKMMNDKATMLQSAMRSKIARGKAKENEKQRTFDILLR